MIERQRNAIQVICDLRATTLAIEEAQQVRLLWQKIAPLLVGQTPVIGQPLVAQLGQNDRVALWVVDNRRLVRVTRATAFTIVDILRHPTVRYHCRICKELGRQVYGPLQCRDCLNNRGVPEGQERLCSMHASFVPGRLDAYCPQHKPHCKCMPTCTREATFYCDHCDNLFGDHFLLSHPTKTEGNKRYCYNCYRSLFSPCVACRQQDKKSLGKLSCAYNTRETKNPCDIWLCQEHAQQWKIWGPHHQGITLCEEHKKRLRTTAVEDVLAMMITARSPRGHYFRLTNAFRLRRILNRNRDQALTFEEIATALQNLSPVVTIWDRRAQRLYDEIKRAIAGAMEKQVTLLQQVKAFYQKEASYLVANAITGLAIVDRFSNLDQQGRFKEQFIIDLYLESDEMGQYIGWHRNRIEQLKQNFNFSKVRFYDVRGRTPVLLN